jgi:hypothetical protein
MLKIEIHGVGVGTCSYSRKENVPGYLVTFGDGFLNKDFVSEKVFANFIKMRAPKLPPIQPAAERNGEVADAT